MSNRMQWEKFWYRDFCDDLRSVSLSTKGFWIFCLSEMWGGGGNGEITGSIKDFSRWCGCDENEAKNSIEELKDRNICDVIFSSRHVDVTSISQGFIDDITLRNRRLKKDEKIRENARLRRQRWNEKQKRDAEETSNGTPMERPKDAVEEKKNRRIEENTLQKNSEIKLFIDHWFSLFQTKFSKKYLVTSKDTKITQSLLKSIPLSELQNLSITFFESNDDFIKKSGYTIGVFSTQINKLQSIPKSRWK